MKELPGRLILPQRLEETESGVGIIVLDMATSQTFWVLYRSDGTVDPTSTGSVKRQETSSRRSSSGEER